jgi:hypothetical protein
MRLGAYLLIPLLFVLVLAACSAGGGHRSSAARPECQDPDWFGLTACSCGRCDRDGFDWSERRGDRAGHESPERDPPPFAGKDN